MSQLCTQATATSNRALPTTNSAATASTTESLVTHLAPLTVLTAAHRSLSHGYKGNPVERAVLHRCYSSNLVASISNASVFALIGYSFLRNLIPNRRLAAAAAIIPSCLVTAALLDPSWSCYLKLARQLDSPLGADVRTVLRSNFPGNNLTGSIDAKDKERAEKDRQSGTGLPLLYSLPASSSAKRGDSQQEQQPLEQQSEADVMVMTEDEPNGMSGKFAPLRPTRQPTSADATSSSSRPPPSSSSSPLHSSSSAPASRTTAQSSQSRSRPSDITEVSPFADNSPQPSAAEAAEEERRRRRDNREKERKQHDDERRQRMAQRSREDGRMSGAATGVGSLSDPKRRFVRRNEFGDEVYGDEDMK